MGPQPNMQPEDIEGAEMWFLSRLKLYRQVKPYMITFDAAAFGCEKTNHSYTKEHVKINDCRGRECDFHLDSHGFQLFNWPTSLAPEEFDSDEIVRAKYYPQLCEQFKSAFPQFEQVHIFAHLRRKRRDDFMGICTQEPEFEDPIIYAHTDFTPRGAEIALREFLDANPHLRQKNMSIVNTWRVTRGPNSDWPLALCDYMSLDLQDAETNDVIHRTHVGESTRLYHNQGQRWYYWSGQNDDEVMVFRNTDTSESSLPVAYHSAFNNPVSQVGQHRESIEIRMACFY